ncbi:MAG: hypothetical protein ACRETU_12385 [Steroidobacterales bacterium]
MLVSARVLSGVAAVAIVAAVVLGFRLADARVLSSVAPPAQDALVQSVDLNEISHMKYIDDRTLDVIDGTGKHFRMELTEDCPGLKQARDFSLVTESFRNLDRFTAIAVEGRVCTFKDFAPRPAR